MKKSVKKTSKAALWMCAVALAGIVGSCNEEKVAVTKVNPSLDSVSVFTGKTVQLNATVEPANATDKSVTWKSANESIATVSSGTITGVTSGNTTVTVASASNPDVTDTIKVTVLADLAGDIEGIYAGAGNLVIDEQFNTMKLADCDVHITKVTVASVEWNLNIAFSEQAQQVTQGVDKFEMKNFLLTLTDTVINSKPAVKLVGKGTAEKIELLGATPDVDLTGTIVDGNLSAILDIGGFGFVTFVGTKKP
jgi:hypothetical protein